ncbi:MAG TPA: thioredoxin family protein, partial [Crocinitomicaceae bacterium]|nr:thioredoxin family protein [Crocinitomicaceae bacterium]
TAWKRQNFPLTEPTTAKDENIKTFSLADFNTLIQQNDVVLVDFHTIWCAPCKKMPPVIDEIEQEYKGKAVIQRIDIDKSTDVGTAFNISGVPVFSIFVKGEQKWTHNGMISKEKLLAELEVRLKYLSNFAI